MELAAAGEPWSREGIVGLKCRSRRGGCENGCREQRRN
jgi:hypothetical protein